MYDRLLGQQNTKTLEGTKETMSPTCAVRAILNDKKLKGHSPAAVSAGPEAKAGVCP